MENTGEIIREVIAKTDSSIVLFLVVLLVLFVVLIPMYGMQLKGKKEQREHEVERDKLLIGVIERNTAAYGNLEKTLHADRCSNSNALTQIQTRLDALASLNVTYNETLIKINVICEELLRKYSPFRKEVSDDEDEQ